MHSFIGICLLSIKLCMYVTREHFKILATYISDGDWNYKIPGSSVELPLAPSCFSCFCSVAPDGIILFAILITIHNYEQLKINL